MTDKIAEEFNLSSKIEENNSNTSGNPDLDFLIVKDVKEFIKAIEEDLLRKYKRASIPIMEIIKKRAGRELK